MGLRKPIRLLSILVLISVFIYWTISAYTKYEEEHISTSTEYRIGDDDVGNLNLPVFTFCLDPRWRMPKCHKHRGKMHTEGTTSALISCMQDYSNSTEFLKKVHVLNHIQCKYLCM